MNWMFDIIYIAALFGFIATIVAIRYALHIFYAKREEKRRMEEEARQIAEANSGL